MFKKLWKKYKRWKCRYDFNKLRPKDRKLLKAMGIDPDGLIKKGML